MAFGLIESRCFEPFACKFLVLFSKGSLRFADTLSISNQHSESDNERDGSP